MYKLFLTFRYLTRKKIVIFPILVVWLCVMMLIIVTSIMGGFVDRVRDANRDLYGDIIISSPSSSQGFEGYEKLSAALRDQFKGQIVATTPVVEAYALLYVGGDIKRSVPALLVGINPEERAQVSKFRESLFQQYTAPMDAVNDLAPRLPATQQELADYAASKREKTEEANKKAFESLRELDDALRLTNGRPSPALGHLAWMALVVAVFGLLFWRAKRKRDPWGYLVAIFMGLVGTGIVVAAVCWPIWFPRQFDLAEDLLHQTQMRVYQADRTEAMAKGLPGGTYKTRADLVKALVPDKPSFTPPPAALDVPPGAPPMPKDGCIVGAQIGFFRRDSRGNFVHRYPSIYPRVSITVFPPSETGHVDVSATAARTIDLTIVDDSHTGVFDVDSLNVYAPLETVQVMAGMANDPKLKGNPNIPLVEPRVHQLLIRLSPQGEVHLRQVRSEIDRFTQQFMARYTLDHPDSQGADVDVQTWDEKQARYLGAVQNEKSMMTFILGLMSVVVLVVIFLIFYQIVRDKTRDIGIIKAVGGSELGVAGIFLSYGLMIGIVGGGLGALSGWLFVTHTNEIHEWIFRTTGIVIWDRSVYLFDRIPDVVRISDVILYFCVALVAGVIGALIPAIIAAFEDPVQAVRYE
jgi:ABC-type lipoprotein release transport system permease subunit